MKLKTNITFYYTFVLSLIFSGYTLFTSIFFAGTLDNSINTQTYTIFYRALVLSLILYALLINIKNQSYKSTLAYRLFLLYWFFLIVRIFLDIYLYQKYSNISSSVELQLWLYIFGIIFPSLYFQKKFFNRIDYFYALYLVWGYVIVSLFITFLTTPDLFAVESLVKRLDANLALSTIGLGQVSASGSILSVYILSKNKNKFIKILSLFGFLISIFFLFRSASRGPLISLIVSLLIWFFYSVKNTFIFFFILCFIVIIFSFYRVHIFESIEFVSPLLAIRIEESLGGTSYEERDSFYSQALENFLSSPIIGSDFALLMPDGSFTYSHNLFLDALMSLGLIGFFIMIIFVFESLKSAIYNIKNHSDSEWVSLLFLQYLIGSLTSGSLYYEVQLNILFVFHLIYARKLSNSALVKYP